LSPRDTALILDSGETVIANGSTTAIDTVGGFLAWVALRMGTITGAGTTLDVRVQATPDGGSNYYLLGKFQQLGPTDDDKFLRIPVYIPRPESGQTVTSVRLNFVVAGGAPSYAIDRCDLEPMVSLAVNALDEELVEGAAIQVSAS